jgi:hypothetical protein
LFTLFFSLSACGIFSDHSRSTRKPVRKPSTIRDKKIDTISWKRIPGEEKPPIVSEEDENNDEGVVSVLKEHYNISVFLPLKADKYNLNATFPEQNKDHERFIQFYCGLNLAVQDLNKFQNKLSINCQDTEGSTSVMSSLLREKENREADLFIGPYDRDCLSIAAKHSKSREIPLVSPWQASSKITDDNPFYIQIRPDLSDHYDRIIEHSLEHFPVERLVILGTEKPSDQNRVEYIQKTARVLMGSETDVLQVFNVDLDSLEMGETAFDSLFIKYPDPVVILPNWSFSDQDFIYSTLRRLNIEKGLQTVHVYGMPILMESEKIDFDFYRQLNMRICRSKFVDNTHPDISNFRIRFYNAFGSIPSDDAYEGYDLMHYIGAMLLEKGTRFQYFLDEDSKPYMQSSYRIEKDHPEGDDRFQIINYFKNKHLDLIQYDGVNFSILKD